jgi:hypothetical protein
MTCEEFARKLIAQDYDKICPLSCGKDEWADGDGHKHKEWCPFAIAYQVLIPEEEDGIEPSDNGMDAQSSAIELAQSLNFDAAVRVVAKSGKNHDQGPNWYAEWDELAISATFGAGINGTTVSVVNNDVKTNHMLLYHASDYGRHIKTFRPGPWVERLLKRANELRKVSLTLHQERKVEEARRAADNFKGVNF